MSTSGLVGSGKGDPQSAKQWAAEDFAIEIGLLRECPFHGQPFKTRRKGRMARALAGFGGSLDPFVKVFEGDTRALLATVEQVAGHYSERCELCARSDEEEFD